MVLEFNTATFTRIAGTGNQEVTGVGFTPKVVIIQGELTSAVNTFTNEYDFDIGIATDTTAANQRNFDCYITDGIGTSDLDSHFRSANVYGIDNGTSMTTLATLTTLGVDGFTLNWSSNGGGATPLSYIAIGGSDVTDTASGHFVAPSATGDDAVTGVGFMPDVVLLIGTNQLADDVINSANAGYCIGMFNDAGEQGVLALNSVNGAATSDTARYQRTDKALALFAAANTTTLTHEATFSSMDGDGFTLNYTTASVANKRIAYIAIKGIQSKISSFTSPTAGTAPVAQSITGTGFAPEGMIFLTGGKTAGSTIVAHNRFSLGAARSSSNETCLWGGDEDGNITMVGAQMMDDDACIRVSDEAGSAASTTTQALADFTSLDSDGFELNWSVKDASNAYEIIYMALGDAAAVGGGTDVRERNSTSLLRQYNEKSRKRYSNTSMVG